MDQVEALVFDGGNILFRFDKGRACRRLATASYFDAGEIAQIIASRLEKPLESGILSESAFCNELIHHCRTEGLTISDVQRIWGNIISPNPDIEPIVDRLIENGTRLGVLSNTNGIHWPYIMDVPVMRKLQRYGATFSLSYEVGASKPDRKIFDHAIRCLGVEAAQVLYLDDIEEYVVAARNLGMQAEQYDCTKDASEKLEGILRNHRVL